MPGPQPAAARGPAALSRDDWVDRALERLAADGVDKVLITPLARELGVTKGSFYWHFDDRRDLLDAMVERWERVGTEQIIEQVDAADRPPAERLRQLLTLSVERIGGRLEPALRDWARRDARVRKALQRVDERRMAYLCELFAALCDDPAEAEAIDRDELLQRCLEVLARPG
jgi:AcrR family transcriptional regulator